MEGKRSSVDPQLLPLSLSSFFRGEFQVCILSECIGWRTALHEQQAPTAEDPTGPPAAVDGRAEQTHCQVKTAPLTTPHQAGPRWRWNTGEYKREGGVRRKDEGRDVDTEKQ